MTHYLTPGVYVEEKETRSSRREIKSLNVSDRSHPDATRESISCRNYGEKKIEDLGFKGQEMVSVNALTGSLINEEEIREDEPGSYPKDPASIRSAILFDGEEESERWPNPYTDDIASNHIERPGFIFLVREKIKMISARAKSFLGKAQTEKTSSNNL